MTSACPLPPLCACLLCSAAIRCAGRAGDPKEAAQLWESMRSRGVEATAFTYSCLADGEVSLSEHVGRV